eukprot:IDg9986t1
MLQSSKLGFIDSSCTTHMRYDRSLFSSYSELPPGGVEMVNKAMVQVTGKVNSTEERNVNNKRHTSILKKLCFTSLILEISSSLA